MNTERSVEVTQTLAVRRRRGAANGMAVAIAVSVAFASPTPAWAQYSFDQSRHDDEAPGVRYFGSAKDSKGSRLSGVTFVFDTGPAMYVFVTDDEGRFRGKLPLETTSAPVQARCSKPGYQLVRVTQRPGPKRAAAPIQVDCILQAAASG